MYPGRGGAASVGSGGLAAQAKRDRALSVRGSNRAASAAARGAAAAAVASAALPSSGELGEGVVWESDGGFLSVFERTMELPDPDEPPGEGDESAGGAGGGDELGGASPGMGSLGRVRRQTVRWHVTGSPRCNFTSVVVFAYDTRSKTCSLIREYAPGADARLSAVPGGMFEPARHRDALHAAREELNEEAGLTGGTWYKLSERGVPKDKYSKDVLVPFLVLDGDLDPRPRAQDPGEDVSVEHGVPLSEALRRVFNGEMPGPAAMVTLMAVEKLRQLGLVAGGFSGTMLSGA